jgi:hypothetical protein
MIQQFRNMINAGSAWYRTRWHTWQQWRQWTNENKNVPLQQFRNMVDTGSTWYQTPGKQQWAEWELLRRKHLTARNLIIALISLIVTALIGKIVGK